MSIKDRIACPVCKANMGLTDDKRSYVCAGETKRYCFDLAKSGYLNLSLSQSATGDSKEAVRARTSFLEAGYYEKISDAINEMVQNTRRPLP
jgi:23S rRNA (guanine745-N1)-methyltransferase